jgi:uncharacterized protein with HEPN domain
MPSDARAALRDLQVNIDLATEFVAGVSYEAFRNDTRTIYAVTRWPAPATSTAMSCP